MTKCREISKTTYKLNILFSDIEKKEWLIQI